MTTFEIKNYYQVTDLIATSGQPTKEQFTTIAQEGYKVVINLAMPTSTNAIADEGAIVTGLGMVYIHIPVVWESPKIEDVSLFFEMMKFFQNRQVWVHCALNMRVSCFIYLYQKHVLQMSADQASHPMLAIWQPEGAWQELIEESEKVFC